MDCTTNGLFICLAGAWEMCGWFLAHAHKNLKDSIPVGWLPSDNPDYTCSYYGLMWSSLKLYNWMVLINAWVVLSSVWDSNRCTDHWKYGDFYFPSNDVILAVAWWCSDFNLHVAPLLFIDCDERNQRNILLFQEESQTESICIRFSFLKAVISFTMLLCLSKWFRSVIWTFCWMGSQMSTFAVFVFFGL